MGPVSQSAGKAAEYYYEKDPFHAPGGKGENSQWRGGGLKDLRLEEGERIKGANFMNIIHGRDLDGNQLVRLSYGDENGRTEHRAGVDFTFDDPKGVSITEYVLKYKVDEIEASREAALNKVLDIIDKNYIYYRETKDGVTKSVPASGRGIMSVYQHSLSRMNDPQSHNHVLICNMINTPNGYRALDNTVIYRDQKYLTAVYQAEMAASLAKAGFAIENKGKGLYDIDGIEKQVIEQFSKRSKAIKEKEAELKTNNILPHANDAQINRIATLETRPGKNTTITKDEIQKSWEKQITNDCHKSKDELIHCIEQAYSKYKEIYDSKKHMNEMDCVKAAIMDRTARESTFTREEIIKDALSLSIGRFTEKDISKTFLEIEKLQGIKCLDAGEHIYSTPDMIITEQKILENLKDGQGKIGPIMTKGEAEQFIDAYQTRNGLTLTDGQRELYFQVMTSKDQFILAQGDAGTGKTTIFKSIIEAAASKAVQIEGYSKTGKAVQEFKEATGMKGYTVDSFLMSRENVSTGHVDSYEQKFKSSIRVIDEASMLGSRQTLAMIDAAKQDNCHMVLMGDVKQLQSLDAGRIFRDAQEKGEISVLHLSESLRQKTGFTKELATAAKNKCLDKAQYLLEANGKLTEINDRDERLKAVKDAYFFKNGMETGTRIITQTNADRKDLNSMIRDELKAGGKLQEGINMTIRECLNMSESDKRFAHNYQGGNITFAQKSIPGMKAGTEAKVIGTDALNNMIQLETAPGKELTIDIAQCGDRLQSFQTAEMDFAVGDLIAFTKNDKMLNVQNGLAGVIRAINENGGLIVEVNRGRMVNIKPDNYQYIDHGYAITDYKSQGASYDNVIFTGEADRANSNQFYVAASRTREDFQIFVDNKEAYFEKAMQDQEKTSTLDYTYDSKSIDNDMHKVDCQIEIANTDCPRDSNKEEIILATENSVERDAYNPKIESDFYVASDKDYSLSHEHSSEEVSIEK
ncbi:MAG: MobF family relaxase [Syntrophales bacterium]